MVRKCWQVDQLLEETNVIHKDIKFSEENDNKTINYLNLTLTMNSEGIDYKIYRKPTCADTSDYPEGLFHHLNYKMSIMENYCHWVMIILKDELNVND